MRPGCYWRFERHMENSSVGPSSSFEEVCQPLSTAGRRVRKWMVPLLGIILAASTGTYFYWKLVIQPGTPQYALDRFFEAANARDYAKLYDLIDPQGSFRVFIRSGTDLENLAKKYPDLVPVIESHEYRNVSINGDKARIQATVTARRQGRDSTDTLDVEMTHTSGIWRIDGSWLVSLLLRSRANGLLLNGQDM